MMKNHGELLLMYGVLCDPAKCEDSYLFSEFLESSSMMVVFTSSS